MQDLPEMVFFKNIYKKTHKKRRFTAFSFLYELRKKRQYEGISERHALILFLFKRRGYFVAESVGEFVLVIGVEHIVAVPVEFHIL